MFGFETQSTTKTKLKVAKEANHLGLDSPCFWNPRPSSLCCFRVKSPPQGKMFVIAGSVCTALGDVPLHLVHYKDTLGGNSANQRPDSPRNVLEFEKY